MIFATVSPFLVRLSPYLRLCLLLITCLLFSAPDSQAIESIGLEEKIQLSSPIGNKIDTTIRVIGEQGDEFPISSIVNESSVPVLVVPVYYHCPRLCGLVLNGVVDLIKRLPLKIGRDYKILTVSFDPSDTPKLAAARGVALRKRAGVTDASAWMFTIGQKDTINRLMEQVGFRFIKEGKDFAHGSILAILSPAGIVSHLFTGVDFPETDVRLAIIESSRGSLGTLVDHVMLFCFKFDPLKGRYTLAALTFFKVGSVLCVLVFAGLVFYNVRRRA